MPGVVSVAPRVSGGLLDTIAKGVQIARDVYGIKEGMDKSEENDQKRADEQAGIQPANEKANLVRWAHQVPEGTPGAIKQQFHGDAGPLWYLANQKQQEPKTFADAIINGKHGTATYDPSKMTPANPNAGLVGFVETSKPPVEARNFWESTGQVTADGSPVDINRATGERRIAQTGPVTKLGVMGGAASKDDKESLTRAYGDLDRLGKDLDNELASSRSGIGLANNKVNSAKRLMTFADVSPDEVDAAKKDPKVRDALVAKLDQLTPQQYTEVVSGLMGQLNNGGQGSFGQLEELRANTAEQRLANLKQYFTSNPAPAGTGQLLLNNMMTLKNEMDTSQKVLDDHASKMMAKHPSAFKHDATKDDAAAMLSAFKSAPTPAAASAMPMAASGMEQTANAAPPSIQPHPQDNAAIKWANANRLSPDPKTAAKALDILRINGVGGGK